MNSAPAKSRQSGFTLLELLVVIAILGILAAITIVSLNLAKTKARDSRRIAEITQFSKALEIYYSQNGYYPNFCQIAPCDGGHDNAYYQNLSEWSSDDVNHVWNNLLNTLRNDGYISAASLIQDPSFAAGGHWQSYAYMPGNNLPGLPQSYRLRVKFENNRNALLDPNLNGELPGHQYYWENNNSVPPIPPSGFHFCYTGSESRPDQPYLGTWEEGQCTCDSGQGFYCITASTGDFQAYKDAKPVIYLYPTEKTEVTVKIHPRQVENSIPIYNNGWRVTAYPDGRIINLSDQKIYPYLFWDGSSIASRIDRRQGFVVARDKVDSFLADKLIAQGLNKKEAADFIDFWAPHLKNKAFVYIYFMPPAERDLAVPMEISPAPDTVIRVYMLYKSLDQPINIAPQKLIAPERRGFTVVEWGGDLNELK